MQRLFINILAILFFIAGALLAKVVMAQAPVPPTAPCEKRVDVLKMLSEAPYHEIIINRGKIGGDRMMEVTASASGTWTVVITRPGGCAMIVAGGDSFQEVAPVPLPGAEI